MIKLKLSFGEDQPGKEFEIVAGELLSDAFKRALDGVPLEGREGGDIFTAVVNGHIIEKELWPFTKLQESDLVVISPKITSGDSGQFFKQVAILVISVVASVYLGPEIGEGIYGALAAAGITLGAALILNALIPPPVPDTGALSGGSSLADSQMYSIQGQSNEVKRYDIVPKVYGTHRIFPNVAAIPYTELALSDGDYARNVLGNLEFISRSSGRGGNNIQVIFQSGGTAGHESVAVTDLSQSGGNSTITVTYQVGVSTATQIKNAVDSSGAMALVNPLSLSGDGSTVQFFIGNKNLAGGADTGKPVQYLYAIYDFGLGVMDITTLQIGDTPLTLDNFTDFSYNIVDPNRPDVPETIQDVHLAKNFILYKGQSEATALAVGLDGNMLEGAPQDTYEAIRDSSPNPNDYSQEIILNFACPAGLYGFDAQGNKQYRRIDLDISFAKVGTDVWYKYNDPNVVSTFKAVGGQSDQFEFLNLLAPGPTDEAQNEFYDSWVSYAQDSGPSLGMTIRDGTNKLLINGGGGLVVGNQVFLGNSVYAGAILSVTSYGPNPAYNILTLDRNFGPGAIGFNSVFGFSGGAWDGVGDTADPASYSGWNPPDLMNSQIRIHGQGLGQATIQRGETVPVFAMFRFTPKNADQYQVRIRRMQTSGPFNTTVGDDLVWEDLTTRFDRAPIVTDKRHMFLELKIRATNQLSGTIGDLSAVCSSRLDVYDPDTQTWSKQINNNPAWVFVDMLIGEVNKKAVDKSRLDLDSIVAWADYCDEIPTPPPTQTYTKPRFQTNFVLDFDTTLQQVLNQVAGAANASLNLVNGKYGVLIDKFQSTPVQVFTPRNSKNFTSSRIYGPRPDGLTVKWIDPLSDWAVVDLVVYDDGFDATNAENLQDLQSFACTNSEQTWRFGRYMIAQNKLRQETISLQVDFEQMVCNRGDFVQITQDVMRVGGTPARVKSVVGTVITIDDDLEIDDLLSYGYVLRSPTAGILTNTLTVVSPNSFDLDGTLPAVGDLVVIGEVGSIVLDCIVKSISPNDDMSAQLVLVEKADAIYDSESSGTLPDYNAEISLTSRADIDPPRKVENLTIADLGHDCNALGTGYTYFIDLIWDVPIHSVYELFSVMVNVGLGFTEIATTRGTLYRYTVDQANLGVGHEFKVIAVSATGKKLIPSSVDTVGATPVSKDTPPSDVSALVIDITNEVIQLSWPKIPDCDAQQYIVRYSPSLTADWANSVSLLKTDGKTNLASTQARTGTYLVKAVDFNGNVSANPAIAITTIPRLFNLNVVEDISESPGWIGGYDRTKKLGLAVVLDRFAAGGPTVNQFYPEGYYYYKEHIDLGEIYTVRLQSNIQAAGYGEGDLLVNWLDLTDVDAMNHADFPDWEVETQYRTADSLEPIANWLTLTSVDEMTGGVSDTFKPWKSFIMSDATGRIFQFRLKLNSNRLSVSPRVYSGAIRADMPDRVESYEGLVADASAGIAVTYDFAFKGPAPSPNIQVSIDSAETGDYWSFDYKTLDGFLIRIFDNTGTQVERTIDVAVKGYGRKHTTSI